MSTVRSVLDNLASGRITLDQAAADFRARSWTPRPRPTDAQLWGVADDNDAGVDGWLALDSDSRLTSEQYRVLADAARTGR